MGVKNQDTFPAPLRLSAYGIPDRNSHSVRNYKLYKTGRGLNVRMLKFARILVSGIGNRRAVASSDAVPTNNAHIRVEKQHGYTDSSSSGNEELPPQTPPPSATNVGELEGRNFRNVDILIMSICFFASFNLLHLRRVGRLTGFIDIFQNKHESKEHVPPVSKDDLKTSRRWISTGCFASHTNFDFGLGKDPLTSKFGVLTSTPEFKSPRKSPHALFLAPKGKFDFSFAPTRNPVPRMAVLFSLSA